MQKYTFHHEIRDTLAQFLQAFDGAIVKRYNESRTAANVIGVRYVYSPKQRVLHDLVNRAQHITLPAVAFWISGINRDPSRVFNKLEGRYWTNNFIEPYNTAVSDRILQPVPIDIEVSVSILTRFQTDMDQILSNFVPYNDPYFIISWTRDGMPGLEIRSEVLWNGNLAMGYPVEQQAIQPTRVTCDTSFTIKGWVFKYDADAVGKILKIDTNFYPVSASPTLENIDDIIDPNLTEMFVLSAAPQIQYTSRYLLPVSASGIIDLYGDMFSWTTSVYVSGASGMFIDSSTADPFVLTPNLSAIYPPLGNVAPAINYVVQSDNKIVITYPPPQLPGAVVLYVVNNAGYAATLLTST